jgi:dipeptidyl aminopeptidase/acylaminoacyl peptidase
MFKAVLEKNIPVTYLLFKGEQHGFRQAENIKKSLDDCRYS